MKKICIALFLIAPLLLAAAVFATPDRRISENENRVLKTKQSISADDFQNDIEQYLSDQIFLREEAVAAKSALMYALFKRDIGGVYIGKNGFLQKKTESDIDTASAIAYAERINKLAEGTKTYVMFVPSAGCILKDELPAFAQMYDFDALYNTLSKHLPNAAMIKISACEYYKTDHHWTADGAYSAYTEWCRAHGAEPKKFEYVTVATDFKGTLFLKALLDRFGADTIKAPVVDADISVTADGKQAKLYDYEALKTKDKYSFFEGGNHGIVTIENKKSHSGKTLLILKDSFANSFVPYIVGDYEKIIMLDERYTFTSPAEIIKAENVTELAVIKEIQ